VEKIIIQSNFIVTVRQIPGVRSLLDWNTSGSSGRIGITDTGNDKIAYMTAIKT
jgi:hypothetical protein